MILVRLWKSFRTAFFRMSLSTFWGELWLFEYMGVISHSVWSCLTNCEKTVRCDGRFDWWFLWGLESPFERRVPYVSIDFLRWAMAVWIYGGYITMCEVASLIGKKTVRCDADLIDDSCEALKDLPNGVFRMSLSTFWGELWLFEYMGVISHMCGGCLTNCEETVKCDADLINDSCEALGRPFERRFPYVSIDFLRWAMAVWIYGGYITSERLPH